MLKSVSSAGRWIVNTLDRKHTGLAKQNTQRLREDPLNFPTEQSGCETYDVDLSLFRWQKA
jgi:hypothetical protein